MDDLTFRDLNVANVLRCEKSFHSIDEWSPSDWATAVAGEVGEACNFIKKMRRGDTMVSTEDVAKELADAIIYIDLLASNLHIDLGRAVIDKFNEVSRRVNSDIFL